MIESLKSPAGISSAQPELESQASKFEYLDSSEGVVVQPVKPNKKKETKVASIRVGKKADVTFDVVLPKGKKWSTGLELRQVDNTRKQVIASVELGPVGETTIGRRYKYDGFRYDDTVSGEHFVVGLDRDGNLRIADFASTNGTYVSAEVAKKYNYRRRLSGAGIGANYTVHIQEAARRNNIFTEADAESPHGYIHGYKLIGRNLTSVRGAIYPSGELTVVDDKSPELRSAAKELREEVSRLRRPSRHAILDLVRQKAAKKLPYDLEKTEGYVKKELRSKKGKLFTLSEFISTTKAGVCRHQAPLAAFLMETLIEEGVLDGTVGVETNQDYRVDSAHAWAVFHPKDGVDIIVDPAQHFVGDRAKGEWRYIVERTREDDYSSMRFISGEQDDDQLKLGMQERVFLFANNVINRVIDNRALWAMSQQKAKLVDRMASAKEKLSNYSLSVLTKKALDSTVAFLLSPSKRELAKIEQNANKQQTRQAKNNQYDPSFLEATNAPISWTNTINLNNWRTRTAEQQAQSQESPETKARFQRLRALGVNALNFIPDTTTKLWVKATTISSANRKGETLSDEALDRKSRLRRRLVYGAGVAAVIAAGFLIKSDISDLAPLADTPILDNAEERPDPTQYQPVPEQVDVPTPPETPEDLQSDTTGESVTIGSGEGRFHLADSLGYDWNDPAVQEALNSSDARAILEDAGISTYDVDGGYGLSSGDIDAAHADQLRELIEGEGGADAQTPEGGVDGGDVEVPEETGTNTEALQEMAERHNFSVSELENGTDITFSRSENNTIASIAADHNFSAAQQQRLQDVLMQIEGATYVDVLGGWVGLNEGVTVNLTAAQLKEIIG